MMQKTLNRTQFDILDKLAENPKSITQRDLAAVCGVSIGTVNKAVKSLRELDYIGDNSTITQAGLEAMEPYRVKRAIILAAGFGSRLVPVTLNTPKPLVRLKGVRIIDTLLDALYMAGIKDIVLVRGYLAEQFDQLLLKYPGIRFIDNPMYNVSNNISSLFLAREYLDNTYICEADLVIRNPKLIKKYQYSSNFLGVPVDKTDDWCFTCTNGYIDSLKIGGYNCFHTFGISYWSSEDCEKLREDVKYVFNQPGGKESIWDLVPMGRCIDNYKVEVRQCRFEDITEIDTYAELSELDSNYVVPQQFL